MFAWSLKDPTRRRRREAAPASVLWLDDLARYLLAGGLARTNKAQDQVRFIAVR
jgi:hypothetical protein